MLFFSSNVLIPVPVLGLGFQKNNDFMEKFSDTDREIFYHFDECSSNTLNAFFAYSSGSSIGFVSDSIFGNFGSHKISKKSALYLPGMRGRKSVGTFDTEVGFPFKS